MLIFIVCPGYTDFVSEKFHGVFIMGGGGGGGCDIGINICYVTITNILTSALNYRPAVIATSNDSSTWGPFIFPMVPIDY